MEPEVYQQLDQLENHHWWFCGRRQYLRSFIERTLFTNKVDQLEFCEIGAGTGGNLAMLCEFAKLDVVELNDSARKKIEDKKIPGVDKVLSGWLPENIPLSEKYDAVFALDVIEHIEDDAIALQSIKNLLKKDGWLITTVPAYQWLWSAHDEANHHKRRYTKKNYSKVLRQAGYSIEYSSYFNSVLFPLAIVDRLASRFKSSDTKSAEIKLPNPVINKVFNSIFNLESYLAGRVSLPFGLSIIVASRVL